MAGLERGTDQVELPFDKAVSAAVCQRLCVVENGGDVR